MGILPLEFVDEQSADSLGLAGDEVYSVRGLVEALESGERTVSVVASRNGSETTFGGRVRLDTPQEVHYFKPRRHPPLRAAATGRQLIGACSTSLVLSL